MKSLFFISFASIIFCLASSLSAAMFADGEVATQRESAQKKTEGGFYFFELQYSEGINALQRGDYTKVTKVARELIEQRKNRPEGYKLFADVHLQGGLYDQALVYYEKALQFKNTSFLLKEEEVDLFRNIAACYLKKNNFEKAIGMLDKIVEWVDADKTQSFQYKRGEAYFSLGLIHHLLDKKVASRVYFIKAAKDGFRAKIAYLLATYYYVKNDQSSIKKNNLIYYKKKVKNEDRKKSFDYFYRIFLEASPGRDYFVMMKRPDYKKILDQVNFFHAFFLRDGVDLKKVDKKTISFEKLF